jgi:uncharacterized lipoprotein YmbA
VKTACLFALAVTLCGCALNRPDHFYVLDSGSSRTLDARTTFASQVTLRVTLPDLVDRNEMVLVDPDGVEILEHERWAAPLVDQVAGVLGQDIETRREDVIMASRHIAQPGAPSTIIAVEVVQLYLQKGAGVRLEARWRLQGPEAGKVSQGRETFTAPVADTNYASFTRAIDDCLGLLADKLVADLPH